MYNLLMLYETPILCVFYVVMLPSRHNVQLTSILTLKLNVMFSSFSMQANKQI